MVSAHALVHTQAPSAGAAEFLRSLTAGTGHQTALQAAAAAGAAAARQVRSGGAAAAGPAADIWITVARNTRQLCRRKASGVKGSRQQQQTSDETVGRGMQMHCMHHGRLTVLQKGCMNKALV